MKAKKLLVFLFLALLFLGGTGFENLLVGILGVALGTVLLLLNHFVFQKTVFPKGFSLYLLFLLFLVFSEFYRGNLVFGLKYLLLFVGGGLFWVSFFNLKSFISKKFHYSVVILGILFALVAFYYSVSGQTWASPWGLIGPYSKLHHHLGDYWVLVVIAAFWFMRKGIRLWHIGLLILSALILFFSLSRSAYTALLGGGAFLLFKSQAFKDKRKILISSLVFLIVVLFFGYTEFLKPALFSRPYYIQGVLGFFNNPLGVGMGNFRKISLDPAYHIWVMTGYSSVAHNIFLEVLVGTGVFAIPFFLWFYQALKDVFKVKSKLETFYSASFLALTINFFFDSTYLIPTMIFLWFILLALVQKRAYTKFKRK